MKIPCASGGFSRGVNIELHGVVESTKPIKMNSLSQYQIINKTIPEYERNWRRAAECVEVTDPINLETLESRNKIHLDLEEARQYNLQAADHFLNLHYAKPARRVEEQHKEGSCSVKWELTAEQQKRSQVTIRQLQDECRRHGLSYSATSKPALRKQLSHNRNVPHDAATTRARRIDIPSFFARWTGSQSDDVSCSSNSTSSSSSSISVSSNTLTSPEVQEARNSNQDEQLQNSDKNTVNESSSSNQDEASSSDQDEEGKPKTAKEMNSDSVDDSDDF